MEGGVISLPAPAPVSCLANREFQATPTPSPSDESTVLRELNVSVSLAGLDISRGHHGEPDVLGQRRSKCKPKVRTVSKMHMAAKAEKKAALDKAKAEKKAAAANDKAKTETKAAAADYKVKPEKEAAPAGGAAASPERLKLNPYEGYAIKEKRMVKMDHRNSYIKWLLEWDKKPRPPLPNLPETLRSMVAIKAERAHHERVLADFKLDGHAYVQVDVFYDDDPRANLPDDQYEVIHHDSDEEA
ncbi:KNR4/SMI1 homolog [Triticum dicoccoides]|uniref:KNR4/SMI1 homolog n=1 Tax=Triticum dicoccoides TaxID=85692 RepID=UPI001891AFDD|nr:KNR4/SMI1 homolog [Triticum dicoccoides]